MRKQLLLMVCSFMLLILVMAGCQPGMGVRPAAPVGDSSLGFYARMIRGESFFSDMAATGRSRMMITRVAPGGPADRAGIRPGAILASVDGHAARNAESMIRLVRNLRPGRVVKVVAHQQGRRRVFRVQVVRSRDVWGWSRPDNLRRSFKPAIIAEPVSPQERKNNGKEKEHDTGSKALEDFEVPGIHAD